MTSKTDVCYLTTLTNNLANLERIEHALETAMTHLESKEIALANDVTNMKQDITQLFLTTHSLETDVLKLKEDVRPIKNVHHELITLRNILVNADDEIKAKIAAIEKRLPPLVHHSRSAQTDTTPSDQSDVLMPPDYPKFKDPIGHSRQGSFHAWDRLKAK